MSTTTAGVIFIARWSLALALAYTAVRRLHVPGRHLDPAPAGRSAVIYRLVGVDPDGEQSWGVYARSVLAFSAVSILFLYAFQRLQNHLWLVARLPGGEAGPGAGTPRSASSPTRTGSRTRVSRRWATWCRWPGWRCRTSSRPPSASRSRSRWCAGSPGSSTDRAGQLLGRPGPDLRADPAADRGGRRDRADRRRRGPEPLRRHRRAPRWPARTQHITGGPVASQEAIKELGTNGGGFYNANSPTRSRTRPAGRTGSRSSCCW